MQFFPVYCTISKSSYMFESQQQLRPIRSDKNSFYIDSILPLDQKTSNKTLALALSSPQVMTLFGGST